MSEFGAGPERVLEYVQCTGTETELSECISEDAYGMVSSTCRDSDRRTAGIRCVTGKLSICVHSVIHSIVMTSHIPHDLCF